MRSLLSAGLTLSLTLLASPFLAAALLHALTSDDHVALAALHGGIGWWLLPAAPIGALSLHDAHAEVGRASAWSWPAPPYVRFLPPWRLDHVLLSEELRALSAREGDAWGSDHRPIVVTLQR